jgi:hypothetical protein
VIVFFFKHYGQMIPVLEHKGRKDPVAIDALRDQAQAIANLFFEVSLDGLDGHG